MRKWRVKPHDRVNRCTPGTGVGTLVVMVPLSPATSAAAAIGIVLMASPFV